MVKISLKQISDSVTENYKNVEIVTCNESSLRMSVNNGIYDWHLHPDSDEIFIVLEGALLIDIDTERTYKLYPFDFLKIPKGILHRTRSDQRTVNLTFENRKTETEFLDFDPSKVAKVNSYEVENLVEVANENKECQIIIDVVNDHEFSLRILNGTHEFMSSNDELIFGIEGRGTIKGYGSNQVISKGEAILIPSGTKYNLCSSSKFTFVQFTKKHEK